MSLDAVRSKLYSDVMEVFCSYEYQNYQAFFNRILRIFQRAGMLWGQDELN